MFIGRDNEIKVLKKAKEEMLVNTDKQLTIFD